MIFYETTMPNGAVARYHKAVKFEIAADATHAVVNSYHSEEMSIISWQDTYVIPPLIKIEALADVEFVLSYANAPFAGGTIIPDDAATLDAQKARLRAEVKSKRNAVEWAGVATAHGIIDSDPESQRKIFGAVTMAAVQRDTFMTEWRMQDNSIVTLNADDMTAVGAAVTEHAALCQQTKNALDAAIDSAATDEELKAIDLQQNWPLCDPAKPPA